ncbi:proline-rich protein 36, partial [Ixodes scapularis]
RPDRPNIFDRGFGNAPSFATCTDAKVENGVPTGGALQADRSAITLREDVSSVRFEEEVNFEILPPEDPTELQELEQLLEQLSGSSTSLGARPPAGAPAAKSRPTSPAL